MVKYLDAHIIHHQTHPDVWDSIMISFKTLTFMHYTVLKVNCIVSKNCIEINVNLLIHLTFYNSIPAFTERREIYFIAIIDVLTQYGVKKQVYSLI